MRYEPDEGGGHNNGVLYGSLESRQRPVNHNSSMFLNWLLGPFTRPLSSPILAPSGTSVFQCPMRNQGVRWEAGHVFNPAAIVRNGKLYLLYRAEDSSGEGIGGHTSRIGLAESEDGLHFRRRTIPVLFPASDDQKQCDWPGGCEDPRVVESPAGEYVMTYTAWNRKTARLSIATSPDLVHWIKRGPAFANTPFVDTWSKSGSIVTVVENGRPKAVKIEGSFWMYWGEGTLHAATSPDLVHWTPLADGQGKLRDVLTTRPQHFDSALVEPGPPALLISTGIVLIYNGKNADKDGDPSIGSGAYSAGQALFSSNHPETLIDRCTESFLKPERDFEKTGQYSAGTVFTEGLAILKGKWRLFFGTADFYVGEAITPHKK